MRALLLAALAAGLAWSQQNQPRPKVGIALEGGSAFGLAHIGVLEWLEQNRVPIDYIAGTSMGGLVGGLYASGMSPAEMREFIGAIDWQTVLSDKMPYSNLSFRRKEDRLSFPNRLEFGFRHGITMPAGLNQGHQVGLLLDRATLAYSTLQSFDDLPTPFRCTALDLINGRQKVFDSGPLSSALRSTMAIPAAFAPVARDGTLYSDGGSLNNLPVDVAKKMGADIVIAVYLKKEFDPNFTRTLGGVINRNVDVVISANEQRNIEAADILVTIDLHGLSRSQFAKGEAFIERGRAGAGAKAQLLKRFAVPENEFSAHMARREAKIRSADISPAFIEFPASLPDRLRRSLERSLGPHLGKPIDLPELDDTVNKLVGMGRFSAAGYSIAERDGKKGVEIRATEKSYGPPFVNLGFEIDGEQTDDVRFAMTGRLTFMDLGGHRSEWRHDVAFGGRYLYRTEFYKPLSSSNFFVAPRAYASRDPFSFYARSTEVARYRLVQYGLGGDLGYVFNRKAEFRAGHEIRWLHANLTVGSPLIPEFRGKANVSRVGFRYEGADHAIVPRRGAIVRSSYEYYSHVSDGIAPYSVLQGLGLYFQPVSPHGSVLGGLAGGSSFDAKDVLFTPFLLGGPLNYGAYGRNELAAFDYITLTAGYVHELGNLPPMIGDRISAGVLFQGGRVYGRTEQTPVSATPLLILETAAGPVFVGGSIGDRGHRRWFFGVGRVF